MLSLLLLTLIVFFFTFCSVEQVWGRENWLLQSFVPYSTKLVSLAVLKTKVVAESREKNAYVHVIFVYYVLSQANQHFWVWCCLCHWFILSRYFFAVVHPRAVARYSLLKLERSNYQPPNPVHCLIEPTYKWWGSSVIFLSSHKQWRYRHCMQHTNKRCQKQLVHGM